MDESFSERLFRFADHQSSIGEPAWIAASGEVAPEHVPQKGDVGRWKSLGMRASEVMPLGVERWSLSPLLESASPYTAAIYELESGARLGFVRIPHYTHDRAHARIFADLMRRFEANTDALLIDQQNNPGGSLLHMYALCSCLTDRPLPVPLHQVKLWENDLPAAEQVMARVRQGDALSAMDRPLPSEVAWAEFVIGHSKLGRGVLSDPVPLFGIAEIEPAPHPYTRPVFLLSDGLTFSAGEFLAAILKDNRRATLLGENTVGAGGCVRWIDRGFLRGARISLTWTVGLRRNGFLIENFGISPDLKLAVRREDIIEDHAPYRRLLAFVIDQALQEPKGSAVVAALRHQPLDRG